jgi:glycosyltransferase involved in cell wall biosynthesis
MAQTRPAFIVTLDVGEPLPDLRPEGRYSDAWVVLSTKGAPCGLVEVDLTKGSSAARARLQEFIDLNGLKDSEASERPQLADDRLPSISVVVPSLVARIDELRRCIDFLGLLDYPDFEVILVDNRRVIPEHDPLPSLIHNRPWLRIVREEVPGVSAARNAGIARTRGEIVAFTDDDVRPDRGWLRAIGTRMATNPLLDAVSGIILPAELETPAQIWFERYYGGFGGQRTFLPLTLEADKSVRPLLRGSRILVRDSTGAEIRRSSLYGIGAYVAGANMAFRKSSLERVGGFDNTLGTGTPARGGEDLAAIIAILWTGGQVGYEPGAVVNHQHRREYADLLSQLHNYGLGFTAMLTSLVLGDSRHFWGLLSQLPPAVKRKVIQGARRIRGFQHNAASDTGHTQPYPTALVRTEFLAYLLGPPAYVRSRLRSRRESTVTPDSDV